MLSLKGIVKTYATGDEAVAALAGIDLHFRRHEFVSVLGPSGCGKTTLLNIIGGLDSYTEGDLVIDGISTRRYNDHDWDAYRNHSIGFVFQSYNLIPHQTVLANVELALTLSGVSKAERRKRATDALQRVGLGDQLHKKPNQMSGGQMQRVAIARALVNDPQILLADEPTGALDTATSVQIMEILREISKDKLIIMVTHNPDLAERYSTRIIRLLDGRVIGDSDPYLPKEQEETVPDKKATDGKRKKPGAQSTRSMSFLTALSLSTNNLMTKKARTFLTSFAGSIGIIGIAMILALSNGINLYINKVQQDTLASYPISLVEEESDLASMLNAFMGSSSEDKNREDGKIYGNAVLYDLFNSMVSSAIKKNDLASFKAYLESGEIDLSAYIIQYLYDVPMEIYVKNLNGDYAKSDVEDMFSSFGDEMESMSSLTASYQIWSELITGNNGEPVSDMIRDQYELVDGNWPTEKDEILLVVNANNEISDTTLYCLGLLDEEQVRQIMANAMAGKPIDTTIFDNGWTYEQIRDVEFRMTLTGDAYRDTNGDGIYEDIRDNDTLMGAVIRDGLQLHISGIIRPKDGAVANAISGSLVYTRALTEYALEQALQCAVLVAQSAPENANTDILTGLPFTVDEGSADLSDEEKAEAFLAYFESLDTARQAELYRACKTTLTPEYLKMQTDAFMANIGTGEELRELILNFIADDSNRDIILAMLESYTDEELTALVRPYVEEQISSAYVAQMEEILNEMILTPSDAELATLTQTLYAKYNLTSRAAKETYLAGVFASGVDMDEEAILAYVSSLSDTALDEKVAAAIETEANALYREGAAYFTSSQKAAKLAAAAALEFSTAGTGKLAEYFDLHGPETSSSSSLAENLRLFGYVDRDTPTGINIFASTFEDKDRFTDIIADYNRERPEEARITYTDYLELLMSSFSVIINAISYVLIAFVAISLVVSSIMIGIITYISVLERTKEIGILRAIGASKRDVSRVFNAETLLVGFAAGLIGIVATLILCLPANLIIHKLTGIYEINARLPVVGGIALVLISMLLTLIAGLIPSRIAAKKDPVVALRTE